MRIYIVLIVIIAGIILRRVLLAKFRTNKPKQAKASSGKAQISAEGHLDTSMKAQLKTVLIFTKLSSKRFLRDRLAQFFAILFPLIFLFVFGSLSNNSGTVSFKVAVINESKTSLSQTFVRQLNSSKTFKVNAKDNTIAIAKNDLSKNQLDGIIVLQPGFGKQNSSQKYPSGQIKVLYSETTSGTGQTLTSVLSSYIKQLNSKFVSTSEPFSVAGQQLNQKSLTSFDYTFSGLLGFSIIGIGVFGPVNVFPELKKQGILRRLHTTPLRVWQYFTATMLSQAITGVAAIAIQFAVAIEVFHLKVDGNYLEIFIFTILSIFMILGLGLAIGGWAKNERQAAPLSNIVVFPMIFLSGTFFPRYIMPNWLQSVTNYLPLTPVIDGLRQLTTEGKNFTDIGPQLGLMAVWFIVIYAIAFRVFKWE